MHSTSISRESTVCGSVWETVPARLCQEFRALGRHVPVWRTVRPISDPGVVGGLTVLNTAREDHTSSDAGDDVVTRLASEAVVAVRFLTRREAPTREER